MSASQKLLRATDWHPWPFLFVIKSHRVKEDAMDWWQFLIIVVLLLWIIWRLPPRIAQDTFIRCVFLQLDQIESAASGVSVDGIAQKWLDYQTAKIAANKGAPWNVRIRG